MLNRKLLCSLATFLSFGYSALSQSTYEYSVDLNTVTDDKLEITLLVPAKLDTAAQFKFPSTVQGTYETYDYGRFISDFKAFDKNGIELTTTKLDVNSYKINRISDLAKITYKVEDSFDTKIEESRIFEPAGSNIEEGKNFILNTHCFFGYFTNRKKDKVNITVSHPKSFYPSTGIANLTLGESKDIIHADNYFELIDSPIMYCKPDTTTIKVANAKVLVSSYSPNGKVNSAFIARTISEMLNAQCKYLGGTLPVNNYSFIFYFMDHPSLSGSSGALEHSYSSFYVLGETDSMNVFQTLRDVASHEFFHILTPLNIHSYEVGEFDFNAPQMSKHLWLYEGMTEYAAQHMQVKEKLISINSFLDEIHSKIGRSKSYNDTLPFTAMSKEVLDKYHEQYNNVYEKGALIGLCLDLILREKSNGKYGTQDLMRDLAKKYGKSISFNDDDLFNDIEKLTYPEVRKFLDQCVAGSNALPLKEVMKYVGINYYDTYEKTGLDDGNMQIGFAQGFDQPILFGASNANEFGKELGFKDGDILKKFNGKEINKNNIAEVFQEYYATAKVGDKLKITVLRAKKFRTKKVRLKAKIREKTYLKKHYFSADENLTERQFLIRKAWLNLN